MLHGGAADRDARLQRVQHVPGGRALDAERRLRERLAQRVDVERPRGVTDVHVLVDLEHRLAQARVEPETSGRAPHRHRRNGWGPRRDCRRRSPRHRRGRHRRGGSGKEFTQNGNRRRGRSDRCRLGRGLDDARRRGRGHLAGGGCAQGARGLGGAGEPARGHSGEEPPDDRARGGARLRQQRGHVGIGPDAERASRLGRPAGDGVRRGERLDHDQAEYEQVAADVALFAPGLLGSLVPVVARGHGVGHDPRRAEDDHAAARQDDAARREVAVTQAGRFERRQRGGHRGSDQQRALVGERTAAPDQFVEAAALHRLRDREREVVADAAGHERKERLVLHRSRAADAVEEVLMRERSGQRRRRHDVDLDREAQAVDARVHGERAALAEALADLEPLEVRGHMGRRLGRHGAGVGTYPPRARPPERIPAGPRPRDPESMP